MSLASNVQEKATLIWSIADKLTGTYKPHEYGEVILPLTVIRRFDCILADTKKAVMKQYQKFEKSPLLNTFLCKASGYDFYNISPYTFDTLLADPDNIEANFRAYLNGFSKNVQDIIDKFKFDNQITTLSQKGLLYIVLKEFTTDNANLHPNKISNLEMGYIFEEIIRKFSEAHNEDAGQHYTPREVIQLMVNIIFCDDKEILDGNVAKTVYDCACGTGGMLSVADDYTKQLNNDAELICFGQEINDQTFAICKADMLIKGNDANNIRNGNTLSNDLFPNDKFDYILSNPPFGREWKNEKTSVETEYKLGFSGRFGAGLPAVNDSQMLFLENAISKMKPKENGGSKVAIIHNGSPLFTGDAGSGTSEIRRYILENDLLECIVALPNDIFYNTGIATYIWILSTRKSPHRVGKVQLINANELYEKRRKSLGNKRNDIPKHYIDLITKTYSDFIQNDISKIFNNQDFGYSKITIERPYRPTWSTSEDRISFLDNSALIPDFLDDLRGEGEYNPIAFQIAKALRDTDQDKLYFNEQEFKKVLKQCFVDNGLGDNDFIIKYLLSKLCKTDSNAPILYKKGKPVPDSDLRDTENVPLTEDIHEYFNREVLPFAPDSWIDENKTKIGYEIPFTRYFYKYQAPKPSCEIMGEILELENSLKGSLEDIFNG